MKRLKILIIPTFVPYPTNDGGKICTFSFIDKLQYLNDITLFLQSNSPKDDENIELLKTALPNTNITISQEYVTDVNKQVQRSFKRIITTVLRFIFDLIFKENSAPEIINTIDLIENVRRTTPFLPRSKKFIEKLNSLFQNKEFDIIQIEYTENLNLINCLPFNSKKIYIEIESRYSLLNDYVRLKPSNSSFDTYVCSNTKMLEIAYLSKYDAVFALSDKDAERLINILPHTPVYSSPFSVADDNFRKIDTKDFKIEKLVFIGPEAHYPNKDAILFFLNEVYAKYDFSIPIHIVGNWTEATKATLGSDKIFFEGYVDNLNNFLENSIMLVPIRLGGGGLRTKILLAMAQGIPIISTSLGADGFDFTNKEHFLVANTPKEYFEQISLLVNNKNIAINIAQNAQRLFEKKYSQQTTANIRNEIYHKILSNA